MLERQLLRKGGDIVTWHITVKKEEEKVEIWKNVGIALVIIAALAGGYMLSKGR